MCKACGQAKCMCGNSPCKVCGKMTCMCGNGPCGKCGCGCKKDHNIQNKPHQSKK